jgi:hypothetical protein
MTASIASSSSVAMPGAVLERDGKKREVVRLVPANRFVPAAIEWRRPGQEWRSTACSVTAWKKWAKDARQITKES